MGPTINISSWMTVKSKEICFKNIYRRRKNTALPFHFAIAGICKTIIWLLKEDIGKEARVCKQTKNQTKPLKNVEATLKEDYDRIKIQ